MSGIDYDKSEGKALRLLELYFYIEDNPGVKADELVEQFGISPATLYRDIQTLKKLGIGVDVQSANRGGYIIERGNIRFARLKSQDLRPILIAKKLLSNLSFPQIEIFNVLYQKMLRTIREDDVHRIEQQLDNVLYFRTPLNRRVSGDAKVYSNILNSLYEAALNQWQVTISYPKNKTFQERDISPYGLWFGQNAWYLAGWCHKRRELRSFAVDRVGEVVVHFEKPFHRPDNFSLKKWLETSWNAMPAKYPDDMEKVELEFDYELGLEISKYLWHHSQQFHVDENSNHPVVATFMLSAASLETEFLSWVLSFGPKVKIRRPAWLVKSMVDNLTRWSVLYRN